MVCRRWRCPTSSRGPLRDALERSSLRVPQNQLPDGIGDVACLGGLAESEPGHLLVHDGRPATGPRAPPGGSTPAAPSPSGCRGPLVQHQLQDGLAGPDLEEAGAPPPARQYPLHM